VRRRVDKSEVKGGRLTIKLPLILFILNQDEVGGMRHVAVKCIDMS
jgi:hypothetical protein